jgi:hypothetical protein
MIEAIETIRRIRVVAFGDDYIEISNERVKQLARLFYVAENLNAWQLDHLFLSARLLEATPDNFDALSADALTVTDPANEAQVDREAHLQELARLIRGVVSYSDGDMAY